MSHALREAQLVGYYSLLHLQARLTWRRIPLPISRAQLALLLLCLFVPWESNRFSPPSNKKSGPPCKPIFPTPPSEKIIFSIEVTPLHCIRDNTSYMKHLEHLNLYRSNLTGPTAPSAAPWGNQTSPTRLTWRRISLPISRAQLSLQGLLLFLGSALSPWPVCPLIWTSNFFDNLSRSTKLVSYQHSHLQIWFVITSYDSSPYPCDYSQQSFPSSPSHLIAVLTLLFSPTVLMHKPT